MIDSSTWARSSVVVCRRRGNGTLTTISGAALLLRVDRSSSRSGVDVHDDGRFGKFRTLLLLLSSLAAGVPLRVPFDELKLDVDVQLRPSDGTRESDNDGDEAATSASARFPP